MPDWWSTPNARDDHNPSCEDSARTRRKRQLGWTIDLNEQAAWFTLGHASRNYGGGESLERKQELGRTESGGGDLQAQTEQLWQTPDIAPTTWPTPRVTTSGMEPSESQLNRIRNGQESERGSGACKLEISAALFPSPASRDYRSPNLKPYQDRGGQMKGEQLQNFVEHFFSLPDPTITELGQSCWPNTLNSNQLVQISIGSAMDSETLAYSQLALRAWLRQGRIAASPFSGIGNVEDESDDSSEPSSQETAREKKQRKLWAYRQRTMGWANPLKWTRVSFRRRLNPEFVDALMNWPPGWTSAQIAFGAEEMELWLCRERWLLRSSLQERVEFSR